MAGLRRATLEDAPAITRVLADAFLDDPGAVIFEPDRNRRAAILPVFFEVWVHAAIADGGDLVVPAGPAVSGVASWFGPGAYGPGDAALDAAGWPRVLDAFGPAAAERMLGMTAELERQHDRLAPWPHLRLDFFGVDPSVQGTGTGSQLIEHGHRRADDAGLRCYLETFTDHNVSWYGRRGWSVVATYHVASGVPVHALVREPRTSR